jgi:hypothetical protein
MISNHQYPAVNIISDLFVVIDKVALVESGAVVVGYCQLLPREGCSTRVGGSRWTRNACMSNIFQACKSIDIRISSIATLDFPERQALKRKT